MASRIPEVEKGPKRRKPLTGEQMKLLKDILNQKGPELVHNKGSLDNRRRLMEQVVEEFSKATKINLTPDQVRNAIQNERKKEKKVPPSVVNRSSRSTWPPCPDR